MDHAHLVELDSLRVQIIVDNESDSLSSAPKDVVMSEFEDMVTRAGHKELDVSHACYAGHGFSALLTGCRDGVRRSILLDGGPSEELFEHNARRLAVDLSAIDTIVLSHWHADHSAGLPRAVHLIADARHRHGLPPPTVDLHPAYPVRRGQAAAGGEPVPFNPDPSASQLAAAGGDVRLHNTAHPVAASFFLVSGEIPRTTSYETGLPGHVTWSAVTGHWAPDPMIRDERCVVAAVRGRGAVVVSPCSHAGVVNVLQHAEKLTGKAVHAAVGGFHLAGADMEARIAATVADLAALRPAYVCPAHCTGWRAKMALAERFREGYLHCAVGCTLSFTDAPHKLPGEVHQPPDHHVPPMLVEGPPLAP